MSARAVVVASVFALLAAAPAGAGEELPPDVASLQSELELARQGELVNAPSPWLETWELPHEVQREFEQPRFSMKVLDGPDPYVMAGGQVLRAGDEVEGHPILLIESEGVVLDVEGYAVIIH